MLESCASSRSHLIKSLAELTHCISIICFLLVENPDTRRSVPRLLLSLLQFGQET